MFNLEFIKVVKQIVLEDRHYLEHHLNFETWCTADGDDEACPREVDEEAATGCGTTFCLAGYLHYLFTKKDARLSAFEFDSLCTDALGELIYTDKTDRRSLSKAYLTAVHHEPDYDAMIVRIDHVLKYDNVPYPYSY